MTTEWGVDGPFFCIATFCIKHKLLLPNKPSRRPSDSPLTSIVPVELNKPRPRSAQSPVGRPVLLILPKRDVAAKRRSGLKRFWIRSVAVNRPVRCLFSRHLAKRSQHIHFTQELQITFVSAAGPVEKWRTCLVLGFICTTRPCEMQLCGKRV